MNDLDYLRMSKLQKLMHNAAKFFRGIPKMLQGLLNGILNFFKGIFLGIGNVLKDIVMTYIQGDWKTKVSYTVMGFGSLARGQWLRGLLFFIFQTVFNLYLWFFGIGYVSKLPTLGTEATRTTAEGATIYGDNSFLIMLYGVLTFFFIAAFLYTWYVNIKQNRIAEQILKSGKPLKTAKDDVASMLDNQFHKTLLALPVLGVTVFTILPIIFMILVAFTNYDKEHAPPMKLFSWVGVENFNTLLSTQETPLTVTKSVHPDGTVTLSVTAKNGDIFNMYVEATDAEKVEAAIAATLMPPTEFPVTLEAGDAWTLELKSQSRGKSTLWLTLPSGSVLKFTTDKAQLDATNAVLDMLKKTGNSVVMEAVDEKNKTFILTAADGTAVTLNVVMTGETLGRDIDAEFAWSLDGERITFVSSQGEEVTLNVYNVTEVMTPSMSRTFAQVLLWTLIWAFFATFLNYFLGMLVAIMINKKGIKFKKLWRTILVMTIAIPQFISLLYVSKMFAADGLINGMLMNWGWIEEPLPFWTNATWAKCTIIGVNVWIGIPYLMLIATGILMNIPADLYESARIDGANAWQTYMKITLPYMLFVTGPYLLTSFTGNINNFNVIFLLSGGKPTGMGLSGNAGSTDLLITWLYKMTVTDNNYKLAAVLGILVFVVCAVINLVVYNLIPSVKNEEDFQ